jgi:hypothetical protein
VPEVKHEEQSTTAYTMIKVLRETYDTSTYLRDIPDGLSCLEGITEGHV